MQNCTVLISWLKHNFKTVFCLLLQPMSVIKSHIVNFNFLLLFSVQFGLLRNGLWEPYKSNTFAIDVIQKRVKKLFIHFPFFFHVRPAKLTRSSRFAAQYHQNIFEIVFESWNQNNLSKYFPIFHSVHYQKYEKINIMDLWTDCDFKQCLATLCVVFCTD